MTMIGVPTVAAHKAGSAVRRSPAVTVFLTIACLLWWAPAAAQIAEVTISIDGMT